MKNSHGYTGSVKYFVLREEFHNLYFSFLGLGLLLETDKNIFLKFYMISMQINIFWYNFRINQFGFSALAGYLGMYKDGEWGEVDKSHVLKQKIKFVKCQIKSKCSRIFFCFADTAQVSKLTKCMLHILEYFLDP